MSYGHHQFNVSSTFTTNFLLSNLYTTTIAILTTSTLVVFGRTEDALAEQTVALGLVGAVVDGLRLGNLTK